MSIIIITLSIVLLLIVIGLLPDFPPIPIGIENANVMIIEYTNMLAEIGQYMFSWVIWNGIVLMMIVNLVLIPSWKASYWVFKRVMEAKG